MGACAGRLTLKLFHLYDDSHFDQRPDGMTGGSRFAQADKAMPETPSRSRVRGRRRNGDRGQSLVEFTLLAPVLILALLGMAELGNALNSYLTIVNTARDAARLYSQGDANSSSIEAMVERETGRLKDAPDITGIASCGVQQIGVCLQDLNDGEGDLEYDHVSVRLCYDHPVIIGIPVLLPGPVRMCSTTVMRIAQ